MLSFTQARQTILENVSPLGTELVSLVDAVGRVLAEPVSAPWDMPLWDNSAMDGYAVRAADCAHPPCRLRVTGYIPAGNRADGMAVDPGCTIRIMTGAPIPAGADAVVPVEETDESSGEQVTIGSAVEERQHIRFRGEDVPAGERVMAAGTVIRSPEVSMLASFGRAQVPVAAAACRPWNAPRISLPRYHRRFRRITKRAKNLRSLEASGGQVRTVLSHGLFGARSSIDTRMC